MTKNKTEKPTHTPGPWFCRYGKTSHIKFGPQKYEDIGVVYYPEGGEAEALANARLIAAAPDLLAALKALRIGMNPEYPYAKMADAAIAKAEGK